MSHVPASLKPASALRRTRSPLSLALLLAVAIAVALVPFVFTLSPYVLNIFMQAATYAIAVLGMTVVLGYTGQINLAQATFFGLGAYAVGLGTVVLGLNFWITLLLGIGMATVAGFVLGLTTLRLGGHYLAMITISFQQIFDLVLVNWADVTRGPDGIAGIARPSIFGFLFADDRFYLLLCTVFLYGAIAFVWWLPQTRTGRAMRAVRENELAAEVTGVDTLRVKVIAFTLSAALAGIGGAFYAAGFAYISPDNFNFARSIEFLTMVLLGGADSAFGGVFGTGLLIVLPEWLRFLKDIYLAVYGLAVILIMVFLPTGIWGIIRGRADKFRKHAAVEVDGIAALKFDVPLGDPAPILRIVDVQKHFGGVKAVDGISLEVARGTVHTLIGPNGSGKTTTLNVLNGIYKATGGSIFFDGADITAMTPHQRAGLGIGRTFQNIRLFASMSVLENVMVGAQRANNPVGASRAALQERALSALKFVNMADQAHTIVKNLPYGHQRLVEIARALAGHPSFLLLDEPAAGLNQTEKQSLGELLKRLKGHGLTIFLIEHDISLIEQVSDTITVLNFGKKIAEGEPGYVLRHPDVVAAYLGETTHAAA
ncbi:Branched-chain amino acid transport ATP-binding protein LivG (TC 3.A.1.4.1) [Caballeronia glathei]|jgi:branched-chain amino acid transport system permease protein|uniref:ABC transporter n=1 Tax=Caballeronia glathei TaxID=60547 RepID=A0A069PMP6_9BURK|nr:MULTISPECIES: branched-chain amino acid ABC transporter ATP-binding protein/permease [Burkholderiaceae]KDR41890.1 ABC transporter [Caballeronia glathei]TCK36609.1 amino acid/amide ABC transporter membrane protein 2 (HAAT family) /amino acid/amide ABC transporter ATP-binding protein 1 (HAAT family) [Paraburkholderia sp. BL8N3]CDY77075.1 Branched-chain amino acid transport ATP-binding protein LivG (TC 3.A.1.4.1) [Caballeronia glathei]